MLGMCAMVKTERELKLLKKSAAISNSCIPLIEKSLREDITESELARRIEKKINSQGANLAFKTLIASGKRAATGTLGHPDPAVSDAKIAGMGFVDFGASYKGYKSDITVPFVKGKVGKRERKIIQTVLGAYNLAMKSVKVGEPCWKVHAKVNKYMKKKGFRMIHALGHGLGKRVHENPLIAAPSKKLRGKRLKKWEKIKKITFQPNMVFTIEPGVYVKDVGGFRIENDFLMTKSKGLKILTKSTIIKV